VRTTGRALGHEPVLIPPQFVRPFVKTNKSDAADAEAIVEAALRPTMRFAAVKSAEQQSVLVLHRARALLVRQRTMLINAIRSLCGEFGLTVAQGAPNARKLIEIIRDVDDPRLPDLGRTALKALADHLDGLTAQIAGVEQRIVIWHRSQAASRRLAEIPGIGSHHRLCNRRVGWRCGDVSLGTPVRCLARAGSATTLERRQRAAGQHQQTR
jgi:transposase